MMAPDQLTQISWDAASLDYPHWWLRMVATRIECSRIELLKPDERATFEVGAMLCLIRWLGHAPYNVDGVVSDETREAT